MADMEKVMKGLECCTSSSFDPCRTKDCPFAPEGPNDFTKCQFDLMRDAIEIVKEQAEEIKHLRLALDIMKGNGIKVDTEGR